MYFSFLKVITQSCHLRITEYIPLKTVCITPSVCVCIYCTCAVWCEAISTVDILTCHSTGVSDKIMMSLFCSGVPARHDRVTASHHSLIPALINFNIYICAFPRHVKMSAVKQASSDVEAQRLSSEASSQNTPVTLMYYYYSFSKYQGDDFFLW